METTIILAGDDAKAFAMMKVLQSLGVFDVKLGSVTLDFDQTGAIKNVKIEKNYRIQQIPLTGK